MDIPAGCSTHVLTNPHEGFLVGACAVDTSQPGNNSFLALMAEI
jgi:hypothetical protein